MPRKETDNVVDADTRMAVPGVDHPRCDSGRWEPLLIIGTGPDWVLDMLREA